MPPTTPFVQLGRFINGHLELFRTQIGVVEYIAVSHVWGQAEWLRIDGIQREVYASQQKAEFIRSQLPALVGSTPFWMDTLTVNQRDKTEVISVVQIIPAIFRHAKKTLAVREYDCFYECCAQCIDDSDPWAVVYQKITKHARDIHFTHVYSESFLLRLWTLQECLLSHTIHFVKCDSGIIKDDQSSNIFDRSFLNASKALDALYSLGCSFANSPSHQSVTSIMAFIRAFLKCSTIIRVMPPEPDVTDDIFSETFVMLHSASNRSASEARDYIFATMTQFPWYHYPLQAKDMTFSAIFVDLHAQASNASHSFACRLTRAMTESPIESEGNETWLPSSSQPDPTSLGDFLKLLGKPLQADHCKDDYHFTTIVGVTTVDQCSVDDAFELIESAIRFQPVVWDESYRNTELSKYGADPENSDTINRICSSISGLTKDDSKAPLSLAERHQLAAGYRALLFALFQERDTDEWLLQQAMKILTLMFCAANVKVKNVTMGSHWKIVRSEIDRRQIDWSGRLQNLIMLLAAMLSCQIPLSATKWAQDRFTPVCVQYRTTKVLGLIAKHAITSLSLCGTRKKPMISAGRHTKGEGVGMDLVLADPFTKVPVGLLPDFLHQIETDELYVERMSELYHGLHYQAGSRGMAFTRVPLDSNLAWP